MWNIPHNMWNLPVMQCGILFKFAIYVTVSAHLSTSAAEC